MLTLLKPMCIYIPTEYRSASLEPRVGQVGQVTEQNLHLVSTIKFVILNQILITTGKKSHFIFYLLLFLRQNAINHGRKKTPKESLDCSPNKQYAILSNTKVITKLIGNKCKKLHSPYNS